MPHLLKKSSAQLKISHISSGFITVLVGYTSSVAIILQAAASAGATPSELNSWMWALGIGMAISCIVPSWYYKTPILTAWSTPGAALLISSLQGLSMAEAVGAFLFASGLMTLIGLTGWFERIMSWVPRSLAASMLAGILLNFGLGIFTEMQQAPVFLLGLFGVFSVALCLWPRYAIILTFISGLVYLSLFTSLSVNTLTWQWAYPVWVSPQFNWPIMLGVGLPLCLVTLTSQNVPGLAILRAHGYTTPASPLVAGTGFLGVLLAPFGGFAFNLAAISAALCLGESTDPDPSQRYKAAIWAGFFYGLTGLAGAAIVNVFAILPDYFIAALAGLALLGTLSTALHTALEENTTRDAALITLLVTASGLNFFGLGSAFWGLVFGWLLLQLKRKLA